MQEKKMQEIEKKGHHEPSMVTIFANVTDKQPHIISLPEALKRIKSGGRSKEKIQELRAGNKSIKMTLPAVCFSGKFTGRNDQDLVKHSGFVCLDFDHLIDAKKFKLELSKYAFIYAAWISPSGDGVKALVKIANPEKHDAHYDSLIKKLKCDPSCRNVARLCFESFDPEIYINPSAESYSGITEKKELTSHDKFQKLQEWLNARGDAFRSGERNVYLFKLASACCRVGIDEHECNYLFNAHFPTGTDFTVRELQACIKSAYQRNDFNSCEMTQDEVVNSSTGEIIDTSIFMADVPVRDLIRLSDVDEDINTIIIDGWISAETTYFPELDQFWKWRRGDLNGLTGIGNHGKTNFLMWLCILKSKNDGSKWCIFSPETYPPQNFYVDLVEMYLERSIAGHGNNEEVEKAKDFINRHFFYIHPTDLAPTPQYLKERFLEAILKEGVDGCIIDPYNQMEAVYERNQREDQFLSAFLSDISRFAKQNNVYFFIIMHPHKMRKDGSTDYPMPSVYDLAGGAMWNNKLDNLLVYHRPEFNSRPDSPLCQIASKKIKRQKEVGIPGVLEIGYDRASRQYYLIGKEPIQRKEPIKNYYEPQSEQENEDPFASSFKWNDEF